MQFTYVEIADISSQRLSTFGLGLIEVVLGVARLVQGCVQANPVAILGGLKGVISGVLAIYALIEGRERTWADVGRQIFRIIVLIISLCGWVDHLFQRLVERWQRGRV